MLKSVAKKFLATLGYEIHRSSPAISSLGSPDIETPIELYLKWGRIPWSTGYIEYRAQIVSKTLDNPELMEQFRKNEKLPNRYAYGVDERSVEYPWLLSRLGSEAEYLLDAGSTLNHDYILTRPIFREKIIHIVTLAPEEHSFWDQGISYIYDDLRQIPIRDALYRTIACISTLEHIGFDNRIFVPRTVDLSTQPDDYLKAIQELHRVLLPGGRLFITVPYGIYKNYGTFQLFDKRLIDRLIEVFDPLEVEQTYYRYSDEGWNIAPQEICAEADYVDWIMRPVLERPRELPNERDHAAAARAVACLSLIKRS